ncbi:erythromycin esterase family protein [Amycolatopsis suaedae]|nr:erythromycin esterase family protein [Amycolatopsis suaedae]
MRWTLISLTTAALVLSGTATATAGQDPVTRWIDRHAAVLDSADPAAPSHDLRPFGRMVGGALVVGLGESSHGSREQFRLKHRMVRYLVEHKGFRTVAFENDFAGGLDIDRYVRTGEGDPDALVADMSSPLWATEEIAGLLRWMRAYNETHADQVRYLGADLLVLRESSFEAISRYVGGVAPDRMAELERDLATIRPTLPRHEHLLAYLRMSGEERQPRIDAARRVNRLVESLHPRDEYAAQHARTVLGWHEYYAADGFSAERERFIADTVGWWQRTAGGRIAYWAASAHTAAAPEATFRMPFGSMTGTWAGGHLRRRLGPAYVSVGVTFGSGSVNSGIPPEGPAPHPVGPPAPGMLEATLESARPGLFVLDTQAHAPAQVRRWRAAPLTTRMIHPLYVTGQDANAYTLSTASLTSTFDIVVHTTATSPSQLVR